MASSTVQKYVIYCLVVLYALCYQLQQPIEPFLVDKLVTGSAEDAVLAYGRVQSVFGFFQAFGSLLVGYVIDKLGVKVGFTLNFVACALQYYMLSITDSIEMLYLTKLPGICMTGFLCAQCAVSLVTEEGPDRLKSLGLLTTSYTIGGVIGPYIGGVLGSTGDYFIGATYATLGSIFAAVLVMLFIPNDNTSASSGGKTKGNVKEQNDASWLSRAKIILNLAGLYLFVKISTGISNQMARSAQPVILKNKLGFDEAMMGSVMSAQFAFGGFANAFLLAPVTKLLGGDIHKVVRNSIVIMGTIYLIEAALYSEQLTFIPFDGPVKQYAFIGFALFLAIFQYSLGTSITATTTAVVPRNMQGTLMGMEHCIFSLASIFGPLLGTNVYQSSGIAGLGLVCGGVFMLVLAIWALAPRSESPKAKDK